MAVGIARWAITVYNMVSYDRPWWAGISFTLSILEPNLGLICACIATFSPLVQLSYARSKHWTAAKKENFGGEKGLETGARRPSDPTLTTNNEEEPVLGATIYPTESDSFTYDLHGPQALECGHVQPQKQTMQQPHPTQADGLHNWAPATPSTTLPHNPDDSGYSPQSSGIAQSAVRHLGHSQQPDMGLPEQLYAESAYPAYYTEFPSDFGQTNVNNPVYYDATWSQVHQQPTNEETYTGWGNYAPEAAGHQTVYTQN
ncbi:putative Integral membrane protein [Seiridium unicorne]|uniref:Integral membrane protein n=1 Tax=Seiridium unicorne TaxID=138068 RepID=A0ABR2V5S9_9PEZI